MSRPAPPRRADPSGAGRADPSGAGRADPSGAGRADPSGAGRADPSGAGRADPSGAGRADPSGAGRADPSGAGRADPLGDLDLSDFGPGAAKPRPKAAVREVSEAHDFPSRAPPASRTPPAAAKPPQRRRRTGRNVQLNIKATADTIARFTALADARGLAFGALLAELVAAAES